MSADRKNEKSKIRVFKKPLTVFTNNLEFTGIFSKNKKTPQNTAITKISNLKPSRKEQKTANAGNSLKKSLSETKNTSLAIVKIARNIKTYAPVSFNRNNLFSLLIRGIPAFSLPNYPQNEVLVFHQ
jgi:hypothetical protein